MTEQADAPCGASVPVLLVDDHEIWRGGVRSMLRRTEFEVVAEASSGKDALEAALRTRPRLALLDIRMAGGDGLDALHLLKHALPGLIVVMLTTYDNPTFVARAVAGGAAGYLLKGLERAELITALRRVVSGEMLLTARDLARSLRGVSKDVPDSPELSSPLSAREVEVLQLLSNGLSNREIGAILSIADSTVKTHVDHIIWKLGVSDRIQAAVWAARQGILKPD